MLKVHQLVAATFLEPPSEELIKWASGTYYKKVLINHKDGIKTNNNCSNLEWTDASKNITHAYENNLISRPVGESHLCTKLTNEQIIFIRRNYIPKCRCNGARALGRKFGVAHSTILEVVHNRTWTHI